MIAVFYSLFILEPGMRIGAFDEALDFLQESHLLIHFPFLSNTTLSILSFLIIYKESGVVNFI